MVKRYPGVFSRWGWLSIFALSTVGEGGGCRGFLTERGSKNVVDFLGGVFMSEPGRGTFNRFWVGPTILQPLFKLQLSRRTPFHQ